MSFAGMESRPKAAANNAEELIRIGIAYQSPALSLALGLTVAAGRTVARPRLRDRLSEYGNQPAITRPCSTALPWRPPASPPWKISVQSAVTAGARRGMNQRSSTPTGAAGASDPVACINWCIGSK